MKSTCSAILAGVVVLAATPALASGDRTAARQTAAPAAQASALQAPAPQAPGAGAPATLDERLGCGVLLVTIDEVLQRNPQLAAKFSKGDGTSAAMMPMFRLLGVSGGQVLDKAYAEGAAQGLTPTALYRRGVAELSSKFAKTGKDGAGQADGAKDEAMALFSRCMTVAAPAS